MANLRHSCEDCFTFEGNHAAIAVFSSRLSCKRTVAASAAELSSCSNCIKMIRSCDSSISSVKSVDGALDADNKSRTLSIASEQDSSTTSEDVSPELIRSSPFWRKISYAEFKVPVSTLGCSSVLLSCSSSLSSPSGVYLSCSSGV